MLQPLKRLLISLVTVGGGVYLVLSFYLYARQTDFIFFPQREIVSTPMDDGCAYEDVRISVNGGNLHGWWLPAPADARSPMAGRTLLYFHGNGGNVGANAEHACRLNRMGLAVLLFDYRGYGQSDTPPKGRVFDGKINEKSIYADGEAAWTFLTSTLRLSPPSILLYGHSLGGAVAVEMAKRHPDAGALIAESTFTSLLDMANKDPVFRAFPIALVLDQKMESEEKLRGVRMPVLILHGSADGMIPPAMAERLHAAAAGPKSILIVPRAGHENVAAMAGAAYAQRIAEFLEGVR